MTGSEDKLRYLPLGVDVTGRMCVIVGGGAVGTRKARTLVRTGANVTVVAPEVTADLAGLIEAHGIQWVKEPCREEHIEGAFLVVAATDDEGLNREIADLAARQGALVNEASSAEHSKVIFGALLQLDEVTVAVFTDGLDPSQARRTRDRIGDLVDRDNKD